MADNPWMSPDELAEWFGIPLATVYRWRSRGDGPKGYKIGRHVRYRRSDVEAWTETQADAPRLVS